MKIRRKQTTRSIRDPRYCNVYLDANALDCNDTARTSIVQDYQSEVERLELSDIVPYGVQNEIQHPNTPTQTAMNMDSIYTIPTPDSETEAFTRTKIRQVLRGNAREGKHQDDADHLFECYKYGGGYFITHDQRLIDKKKDEIERLLDGVTVSSLVEFVAICRSIQRS